jgi:hypothetical protein
VVVVPFFREGLLFSPLFSSRLSPCAESACVTLVQNRASKSARQSIYCSLYPLAEWIAYNWWLLQAHLRLAGVVRQPWDLRKWYPARASHNVRAVGDGFIWPNLAIVPEGTITRVVWARDREPPASAPIQFISDGAAICSPSSTESALAGLVENVLARLDEVGIEESTLAGEWRAVTSVDPEEAAFCIAAAKLGLDPYAMDDSTAQLISTIGSKIEAPLLADFLDAVDPHEIETGVLWIGRTARILRDLSAKPNPLIEEFRKAVAEPIKSNLPWTVGWEQARQVRRAIGAEVVEPFDVDELVTLAVEHSGDHALQGMGGVTTSGGHALVAGSEMSDTTRRFATARALWHFTAASPRRFLLTASHTDRQKVERAFAAELLAPAQGVEAFIQDDYGLVHVDDLEAVGEHFDVSPIVIRHQVENQLEFGIAE